MSRTARNLLLTAFVLANTVAHDARAQESLEEAWRIARQSNHALQASRRFAEAARFNAGAVEAERWPAVQTQTGYITRSSEPSFVGSQPALGVTSFSLPFAQRNAARFSARASAPLWTAGRLRHSVDAARSQHSASLHESEAVDRQIWYAVAEAYFGVLRAHCSLEAAEQRKAGATAFAREIEQAERQSRVEHREVLAARVRVLEAEHALLLARNTLVDANAIYNQLLGRSPNASFSLVEPEIPPFAGSLEELTQAAIRRRPDIQQLQNEADGFASTAAAHRASKKPQLNAEVGYTFEENTFQSPEGLGTAGVVVDWNPFDAGLRRRRAQEADQKAAALYARQQELRSQVTLEVLHAWNRRNESAAAEQISVAALAHAVEHSRSVQERVRLGLALSSEAESAAAEAAQVAADRRIAGMNRMLADLQLRYACGAVSP